MSRTDDDDRFEHRVRAPMESRSELPDMIDLLSRRLAGAVMIAGALIGAGIYMGGDEVEAQKYQVFAADGEVFRLNTDDGTLIACNADRCTRILERGQELAEEQGNTLFKRPLPAPAQAPAAQLPAPAQQQAAPAPAAQPAPQPAAPTR